MSSISQASNEALQYHKKLVPSLHHYTRYCDLCKVASIAASQLCATYSLSVKDHRDSLKNAVLFGCYYQTKPERLFFFEHLARAIRKNDKSTIDNFKDDLSKLSPEETNTAFTRIVNLSHNVCEKTLQKILNNLIESGLIKDIPAEGFVPLLQRFSMFSAILQHLVARAFCQTKDIDVKCASIVSTIIWPSPKTTAFLKFLLVYSTPTTIQNLYL